MGDVVQGIGYFIIIAPFIILLIGMLFDAAGEGIDYLFEGLIGGTVFIVLLISCIFIGLVLVAVGRIMKSSSEYQ